MPSFEAPGCGPPTEVAVKASLGEVDNASLEHAMNWLMEHQDGINNCYMNKLLRIIYTKLVHIMLYVYMYIYMMLYIYNIGGRHQTQVDARRRQVLQVGEEQ